MQQRPSSGLPDVKRQLAIGRSNTGWTGGPHLASTRGRGWRCGEIEQLEWLSSLTKRSFHNHSRRSSAGNNRLHRIAQRGRRARQRQRAVRGDTKDEVSARSPSRAAEPACSSVDGETAVTVLAAFVSRSGSRGVRLLKAGAASRAATIAKGGNDNLSCACHLRDVWPELLFVY